MLFVSSTALCRQPGGEYNSSVNRVQSMEQLQQGSPPMLALIWQASWQNKSRRQRALDQQALGPTDHKKDSAAFFS
jgi:hypothetical protein